MTMNFLARLEKRGVSIFFLLTSLGIGLLGDLTAQGLLSDKGAKWAAIVVALLTSLKSVAAPASAPVTDASKEGPPPPPPIPQTMFPPPTAMG